MGKSNRVRAERAQENVAKTVKYKNTKKGGGMSLWLKTTIAAVIAAAVLLVCVLGILSSKGIFARNTYPIKTENYKISSTMLSYLYKTEVNEFATTYSDYLQYFSIDTSRSLKNQTYGDANAKGYALETSFLGTFEGTWFDYFMDPTVESAKQMLVFCEEANERGITLSDDELKTIDEAIQGIKDSAKEQKISVGSYISSAYGAGVRLKDIQKMAELEALANKCASAISKETNEAITADDINTKYNAAKIDYDVIDYSYYAVSVSYDSVATEVLGSDYTEAELKAKADEVLAKYKEKILDAKKIATELKAKESVADFNKALYLYLANKYYDSEYAKMATDVTKPDETVAAAIKTAVVDAVVADIMADKEATATAYTKDGDKYVVASQELAEKLALEIDKIKQAAYKSLLADKVTYLVEKKSYVKDDEFSKWAFESGRKVDDVKFKIDGDGADTDDITKKTGSFAVEVYIISKAQYKNTDITKDVAYMLFATEAEAKAAIEAFAKGTLSKEAFEAIAEEKNPTAHTTIEDYIIGTFAIESFDSWLEAAAVGAYTTAPIKLEDGTYLVAYYASEGAETWNVKVRSDILNERYTAQVTALKEKYTVTVKENAIDNING